MKMPFGRMLYGGDYNPNQWPREIWDEDMKLFKDASINSATINVFSWAKIQPAEETFDFSELDDIVDMLSKEGYDIVLATATGAMPAWLVKKYPEVAAATTTAPTAWSSRSTPPYWWRSWPSGMVPIPM